MKNTRFVEQEQKRTNKTLQQNSYILKTRRRIELKWNRREGEQKFTSEIYYIWNVSNEWIHEFMDICNVTVLYCVTLSFCRASNVSTKNCE